LTFSLSVVDNKATAVTLNPAIIPSTLKIFDKNDLSIYSNSFEIKYPQMVAKTKGVAMSKIAFLPTVRM